MPKSNNPSNLISQAAKKEGLSYWEYIEKHFPRFVHYYVWPTKTEKVEGPVQPKTKKSLMVMAYFSAIRALMGGRHY